MPKPTTGRGRAPTPPKAQLGKQKAGGRRVETFCLVLGLGLGRMASTLRETRMPINLAATVTAVTRRLSARSGGPTLPGSAGVQKA
jgi:hypothetical protein